MICLLWELLQGNRGPGRARFPEVRNDVCGQHKDEMSEREDPVMEFKDVGEREDQLMS